MPQYSYTCPDGHAFDAFCAIALRNDTKMCPVCRGKGARAAPGAEQTIDLDAHRGDPRAMSDAQLTAEGRVRKW